MCKANAPLNSFLVRGKRGSASFQGIIGDMKLKTSLNE
jgi:hypothetical protein